MLGKSILNKMKLGVRINIGFFILTVLMLLMSIFWTGKSTSKWDDIFLCIIGLVLSVVFSAIITKSATSQIDSVVKNLNLTSNDLMDASSHLVESSQKLAEGSSEQSASVQETSATMEETSSLVHQTTQNTKEAVSLAEGAKEQAEAGVASVNKLLEAMSQLAKSSEEIQKVIKVIDDMAFQTNILSLNAAVEAARAGDAGKGFAVVAEEVRNLAQRSAQAAQETAVLIDGNVGITKNAVILSEKVGDELNNINGYSIKVKELLHEIATASQEQSIATSQIAQAITQIDHVIQAQSSIAQTSAKDAGMLEEHCDNLRSVMYQLINIVKTPEKSEYGGGASHLHLENSRGRQKALASSPRGSERRAHSAPSGLPGAVAVNPEDIIPLDDF